MFFIKKVTDMPFSIVHDLKKRIFVTIHKLKKRRNESAGTRIERCNYFKKQSCF